MGAFCGRIWRSQGRCLWSPPTFVIGGHDSSTPAMIPKRYDTLGRAMDDSGAGS